MLLSHENNKEENLLINQKALSIMNQNEHAGWEVCHIGSLWGSKESSENIAKTQDLACCSKSLKVMGPQQQEKRLGYASYSLTLGWHLSDVLS